MKTQRRLVAATALAAVTALLAACGGGGSSGGTSAGGSSPRPGEIVYAQSSPTEGFNADSCWQYSIGMLPLVYDQLVRINPPDGDGLAPGLAESWEYDPATTSYLLTLRADATFSDGSPVTPADVVFSVDQWMTGTVNGFVYVNLAGAEAVGDNQVRLTMRSDDPAFINSLAMCSSAIYPANFGGRTAEEFFADPVGAGPFQLENWSQQGTPTERIELTPNPNYWGPAPEVDRFVFESIADPAQRALQFRSGAVDIVGVLDISVARQFQADTLDVAAPAISALLVPNQTTGPFTDPDLRRALSLAIDRQEITDAVGAGVDGAIQLASFAVPSEAPGGIPGSPPAGDGYERNVDEARSLVSEAYPNGVDADIIFDAASQDYSTAAQVLKTQLAAVGITLNLVPVDSTALYTELAEQNFELTLAITGPLTPTILDPLIYQIGVMYGWAGADPTVVQALFDEAAATDDTSIWADKAEQISDDMASTGTMYGVFNAAPIWAVQPWVSGFDSFVYYAFSPDGFSVN